MTQPHYIDREAVALLVSRLRATTTTDHERGCQGREYACSCGWDEETMAIATDAADLIERLSAPMEAVAWRWSFDRDGNQWRYGPRKPGKFRFGGPEEVQALAVIPAPAEQDNGSSLRDTQPGSADSSSRNEGVV